MYQIYTYLFYLFPIIYSLAYETHPEREVTESCSKEWNLVLLREQIEPHRGRIKLGMSVLKR